MKTNRLITAMIVSLLSFQSGKVHSREVNTLEIGERAPDISLPGVDGKTYSLATFDDSQILVVVFTCNHCPTAQAYEERIKELHKAYKDRGRLTLEVKDAPLRKILDAVAVGTASKGR